MKLKLFMIPLALALWPVIGPVMAWAQAVPPEATNDARPTVVTKRHNEIVRVGQDVVVKEGESVREVVVVGGGLILDGDVRHDVVVVAGPATINSRVGGDLVVVMGKVTLGPKAEINGETTVVGGELNADPQAKMRRSQNVLSPETIPALRYVVDWVTQGLMVARPLPPRVPWVWAFALVLLAIYALLSLALPRQTQSCVAALTERPIGSFFTGMLVLLLLAPLILFLVVTVVGIILLPFFLCALALAFVLGKVAVYRFAGQQVGRQTGWAALQSPLAALTIGTLIFYLLYTIPVIGLLMWCLVVPLGLGAVVVATFDALRTEGAKSSEPVAPPSLSPDAGGALSLGTLPRVGFWLRTLATMLDWLLIGVVLALLLHWLPKGHKREVFLLVFLGYHVAMWTWKGTTVGGLAFGLKLVCTNGRPVDLAVALVRALAAILSALVFGLGFFWAGWSRDRQSWHDKIAGTIIVKVPTGCSPLQVP